MQWQRSGACQKSNIRVTYFPRGSSNCMLMNSCLLRWNNSADCAKSTLRQPILNPEDMRSYRPHLSSVRRIQVTREVDCQLHADLVRRRETSCCCCNQPLHGGNLATMTLLIFVGSVDQVTLLRQSATTFIIRGSNTQTACLLLWQSHPQCVISELTSMRPMRQCFGVPQGSALGHTVFG